jgi:iron complex outermembrane receptor protein
MENQSFATAIRRGSIILFWLLATSMLAGQENRISLQILDPTDGSGIQGVSFKIQNQSGLSDNQGMIFLDPIQGDTLHLGHFEYERQLLSGRDLKQVLQSGRIYLQPLIFNAQPVNIIALRATSRSQSIKTSYEEKLAHDGGTLLARIPAITGIRKSGSYGFDPVLRGFKYDQLNIVIAGAQSAIAACPNRMDPPSSQVAPNMTDRVEVLKGPHALRYGNSFGGTINFIPSAPRFSEKQDAFGRLSISYEQNGELFRSEGMAGLRGKKYELALFGSWSEGNDYHDGTGAPVQSDFLRGSFGASLAMKLSGAQQLTVSATRNMARDVDFPSLPMDLRTDDTWLLNARHRVFLNRKNLQSWNTTLYGSIVNHLMDNLLKPLDPRMMNAKTDALTYTYGGRTEGAWQFGKRILYAGADLRIEQAKGIREREFLMGPNAGKVLTDNAWQKGRISRPGVFGEFQLPVSGFQLIFSGRLEVNHARILDAAPEFIALYPETTNTQINPSVSIGGTRSIGKGFSAGMWLGRAQRSGSLTERYINYFPVGLDPYELIGNPDLDPEINNQLDLNLGFKSASSRVDLSLFASILQNYISSEINEDLTPRLPNSPGVRQFVNLDQAMITGFELSWSQRIFSWLDHELGIAYSYGQDLGKNAPLPEISPMDLRYDISGIFMEERLEAEAGIRYVLGQNRISSEFGETETPAFSLLNVKVSYRILAYLRATVGVQNLLDVAYYEHLNRRVAGQPEPIYAPGRNFIFTLTLDLR